MSRAARVMLLAVRALCRPGRVSAVHGSDASFRPSGTLAVPVWLQNISIDISFDNMRFIILIDTCQELQQQM